MIMVALLLQSLVLPVLWRFKLGCSWPQCGLVFQTLLCLLDNGANVNKANNSGWTPLHFACKSVTNVCWGLGCDSFVWVLTKIKNDVRACENGSPASLLIRWPAVTLLIQNDPRSVQCPVLLWTSWSTVTYLIHNGSPLPPPPMLLEVVTLVVVALNVLLDMVSILQWACCWPVSFWKNGPSPLPLHPSYPSPWLLEVVTQMVVVVSCQTWSA